MADVRPITDIQLRKIEDRLHGLESRCAKISDRRLTVYDERAALGRIMEPWVNRIIARIHADAAQRKADAERIAVLEGVVVRAQEFAADVDGLMQQTDGYIPRGWPDDRSTLAAWSELAWPNSECPTSLLAALAAALPAQQQGGE